MNPQIEKLYTISKKNKKSIIGLMSGTSLDGLDIALCDFKGAGPNTKFILRKFTTIPYNSDFKERIRRVFAKKEVDFEYLTMLNPWIAEQHADMINSILKDWEVNKDEIDIIASHGQTVYHAPKSQHKNPNFGNATLQIGDGDHLAVKTGIFVISDFRQKHIAYGGEGAPLAHYGDYLILSSPDENRVLLNIGGIANYTYLDKSGKFESAYSYDTGPGNTLIDQYTQKHFNRDYDKDASIALSGKLNEGILNNLMAHPYFALEQPKTTGPEVFKIDFFEPFFEGIQKEDVLHTLNAFTAKSIAQELQNIPQEYSLYFSGGGSNNPLIKRLLANYLGISNTSTTAEIGMDPDAKEAILFGVLANEWLSGNQKEFGSFGKLSFP